MIPLALSAGLGAASGLYNIFSGISQNSKANKINAVRPQYTIPKGITDNRNMYQNLAGTTRLPGQSILEKNIGAGNAGSINAVMQAGSGSDALAAISNINQNQNKAYNDLAVQGAEFQAMNRDKLSEANQVLAGYQDQEFDYNKNQPYMMKLARKMALKQAGAENISSGLTGISNLASSFIGQGGMGSGAGRKVPTGSRLPVSGFPNEQLYG